MKEAVKFLDQPRAEQVLTTVDRYEQALDSRMTAIANPIKREHAEGAPLFYASFEGFLEGVKEGIIAEVKEITDSSESICDTSTLRKVCLSIRDNLTRHAEGINKRVEGTFPGMSVNVWEHFEAEMELIAGEIAPQVSSAARELKKLAEEFKKHCLEAIEKANAVMEWNTLTRRNQFPKNPKNEAVLRSAFKEFEGLKTFLAANGKFTSEVKASINELSRVASQQRKIYGEKNEQIANIASEALTILAEANDIMSVSDSVEASKEELEKRMTRIEENWLVLKNTACHILEKGNRGNPEEKDIHVVDASNIPSLSRRETPLQALVTLSYSFDPNENVELTDELKAEAIMQVIAWYTQSIPRVDDRKNGISPARLEEVLREIYGKNILGIVQLPEGVTRSSQKGKEIARAQVMEMIEPFIFEMKKAQVVHPNMKGIENESENDRKKPLLLWTKRTERGRNQADWLHQYIVPNADPTVAKTFTQPLLSQHQIELLAERKRKHLNSRYDSRDTHNRRRNGIETPPF